MENYDRNKRWAETGIDLLQEAALDTVKHNPNKTTTEIGAILALPYWFDEQRRVIRAILLHLETEKKVVSTGGGKGGRRRWKAV